jgi:hypothetical protein
MYEINKHTTVMAFFFENGENKFFWNICIFLQEQNASWCQKTATVIFTTGKNLELI